VICDDSRILNKTKAHLENHFVVDTASCEDSAMMAVCANIYQAIIITLNLSSCSAIELIKQIRVEKILTPILGIANNNLGYKAIQALNHGSDDVLMEPLVFDELFARLNAIIRRSFSKINSHLAIGDFNLDLTSHYCTFNKKPLFLQRKQRLIIECLMLHYPRVVTRELLRSYVWEDDCGDRNNLDAQISRLRKKLITYTGFNPITTLHCSGYRFEVIEKTVDKDDKDGGQLSLEGGEKS